MVREEKFKVDIRPDVAALRIFRSMSFTPWYALGEFVDNSITSAMKNLVELRKLNGSDYELRIEINFSKEDDSLTIEDNAAGINRDQIERSLKTGIPPEDTSIGLGKHGVGMKASALWWGRTLTIETYPIDEPHGWRARIDISEVGELENFIEVTPIASRGYPGTRIHVEHLWRKTPQTKTVTAIKAYLPSIYRTYLNPTLNTNGFTCTIEYEGKPLSFEPPKLLTAPYWPSEEGPLPGAKPVLWRLDVEIELSSGSHITGWVGILEVTNRNYSGFFLHYRGKGISGVVPMVSTDTDDIEEAMNAVSKAAYKPKKIFGQTGLYKDISFIGEFDITDFGKTITTDSALWSASEETEFADKLYELMSNPEFNFIRMAEKIRRKKKDKFDELADSKSDAHESRILRTAFDKNIGHADPLDTYDESQIKVTESIGDEDDQDGVVIFDFQDLDEHIHKFSVKLIKDRSRDFLTINEDKDSRNHQVLINQFHSCLFGININTEVRRTLQRIGVGLAISEVMLTDHRKKMVRMKMNEVLRELKGSSLNE